MRRGTTIIATILALALVMGLTPPAMAQEEEKAEAAIEATKAFIVAAYNGNRAELEETFDFKWAMEDINRVFEKIGAGKPYNLDQIKDTLFYHFTSDKQKKKIGEFINPGVTYAARVNLEQETAMVTITKPRVEAGDVYEKETTVGLKMIDGLWKIRVFPEFYPVDPWEIGTGVKGE